MELFSPVSNNEFSKSMHPVEQSRLDPGRTRSSEKKDSCGFEKKEKNQIEEALFNSKEDKNEDKNIEKKVEDLTAATEKYLHSINVKLNFKMHKESGRIIIRVIDSETDKVIREIPPKKILELADHMKEMIGTLFDKKA
ncbi:MAG TPA: flagellar protein FlaG [Desulfobacterales bacterium]|nr:flagellar protein FlaG [Desulfobacterales bacterium]